MSHESFAFHSVDELRQRIRDLGLELELSEDPSPLLAPLKVGSRTLPNRLVVLPMEGCDGRADGSPDALTLRRYRRFASGGAGLLWFEATAVVAEGRANPRQLWIHRGTVPGFADLLRDALASARQQLGADHRPVTILQLTHSGRYSRPGRAAAPIIAHHSPYLDPTHHLPPDYPLITDDQLEQLEEAYVEAARCAAEAGFDGVDVKACHRYLISELHASYTRERSRYGGASWENRSRFFRNVVARIRDAMPGLMVTARLNAYDAMAYPYGFGVDREDATRPDLREPLDLVGFLVRQGAPLVNVTIGNPYYNPHVNRPYDLPTAGAPLPAESPLVGVDRFVRIVREIQALYPELAVIGGGYSWLRQFLPHVAAANVRKGWVSLVGLGRMAFAYPDCVRDLQVTGRFDPQKVCVACSACTQIMRDGGRTGCVPRDPAMYEPIYKEGRADAVDTIIELAKTCRQCSEPTCVRQCPAEVNIPKFVGHIAQGQFREAYATLREANALAAICGYVCPADMQCERACVQDRYTFAVPIRRLQRWVGRRAVEAGWAAEPQTAEAPSGKRVAVLGAGPAGISAANRLARLGHTVCLYDRAEAFGGAAHDVIPRDRLPDSILHREIQDLLAAHGPRIRREHRGLDAQFNLDQLLAEGFDAVLIAVGLSRSAPLPCATRPARGVVGALEWLAQVKRGARCAGTVLVLGGGNTAIDAAISARRNGAQDVSIVYRRSWSEMPAWPEERTQALAEGIQFLLLTAPLDYVVDAAGQMTGIKVVRTRLGLPDADGRRKPEAIMGTEHVIPADLVIEGIGQVTAPELKNALPGLRFTEHGLIWVHPERWETSRTGVFAAGDVVNGGTTVVRAVAEGALAAEQMDRHLRAEPVPIVFKS